MAKFWILVVVGLLATISLDKTESVKVKLEELPLQTFDELFVDEWWDKNETEDLQRPPTNFGQNVHNQIDRQNTQIGQIEPNSTYQNPPPTVSDHSGQIEPNSTEQLKQIEPNSTDQNPSLTESDQYGQIEPNSTDQNPPLTESDHSDNAKNGEEQNEISANENIAQDERKRKIIAKFHEMKDEFKQKGKYSKKERTQIEDKIAKHLKVNRSKIYKWKKEVGLSQIKPKKERINLIQKFDQMKAELKRAGFKNSYPNQIDKTVAKELGLCFKTIYNWKREFDQTEPKHKYAHSEQKEMMKRYYEIKGKNSKIRDADIAKMLKIGSRTLVNWKRQFKRQQFHQNSVDGHAGSNAREICCSNGEVFNETMGNRLFDNSILDF